MRGSAVGCERWLMGVLLVQAVQPPLAAQRGDCLLQRLSTSYLKVETNLYLYARVHIFHTVRHCAGPCGEQPLCWWPVMHLAFVLSAYKARLCCQATVTLHD